MFIRKKELQELRQIKKQFDGFVDPLGSRGSTLDKTARLRGSIVATTPLQNLQDYVTNGFVQNIIDQPAEDATREWIDITTNRDTESLNISRMIENRMDELNIREKIKDLIRYSRMYAEGGFLYYGVIADTVQNNEMLGEPV